MFIVLMRRALVVQDGLANQAVLEKYGKLAVGLGSRSYVDNLAAPVDFLTDLRYAMNLVGCAESRHASNSFRSKTVHLAESLRGFGKSGRSFDQRQNVARPMPSSSAASLGRSDCEGEGGAICHPSRSRVCGMR